MRDVLEKCQDELQHSGLRYHSGTRRLRVKDAVRQGVTLPSIRNGDFPQEGVALLAGKPIGHPRVSIHFTNARIGEETPLIRQVKDGEPQTYPNTESFLLFSVGNDCRTFEASYVDHVIRALRDSKEKGSLRGRDGQTLELLEQFLAARAELDAATKALSTATETADAACQTDEDFKKLQAALERKDREIRTKRWNQAEQKAKMREFVKIEDQLKALRDQLSDSEELKRLEGAASKALKSFQRIQKEAMDAAMFAHSYRKALYAFLTRCGFDQIQGQLPGGINRKFGSTRINVYTVSAAEKRLPKSVLGQPISLYNGRSDASEQTLEFPMRYLLQLLDREHVNKFTQFPGGYFGYIPFGKRSVSLPKDATAYDNLRAVDRALFGFVDDNGRGWMLVVDKGAYAEGLRSWDAWRSHREIIDLLIMASRTPEAVKEERAKSDPPQDKPESEGDAQESTPEAETADQGTATTSEAGTSDEPEPTTEAAAPAAPVEATVTEATE